MTDKEMIEEMARDIAFEFCPNRNLHKKWGNEAQCYSDDNFSECTTIKNAVDKLYNLGYRKIPEGSVVLSNHKYKQDFCSQFNKGYKRGSKETAKKFVNLSDSDILVVDTQEYGEIEVVSVERLQEIARELGVEVKE